MNTDSPNEHEVQHLFNDNRRIQSQPSPELFNRVLGRVRRDVAARDVITFASVGLWKAFLEIAASLYATLTRRHIERNQQKK